LHRYVEPISSSEHKSEKEKSERKEIWRVNVTLANNAPRLVGTGVITNNLETIIHAKMKRRDQMSPFMQESLEML